MGSLCSKRGMRWGTLVADLDENGLVGLWSGEAAPGDFELRVDFGPNSPVGKPINLDALAADVIIPLIRKAGIKWYGWHGFRRGLATNLHQLGVADKTIQRILRHANVAVTQNCYIKTTDSEVAAAMQQFERSLEYAPNMICTSRLSRERT